MLKHPPWQDAKILHPTFLFYLKNKEIVTYFGHLRQLSTRGGVRVSHLDTIVIANTYL